MSWSCPFHSSQLPLHVPVIFSVCPLHFPYMSRSFVASHFPTSPVVPIGFLVLCFPFTPLAFPLFSFLSLSYPFQFPFVSLSSPVAFLSCRLPISSPHFLALPCISPLLSRYFPPKTRFFQRFRKEDVQKHGVFQIIGKRRQETQTSKELGPLFCDTGSKTTFSGTSSNYRAVRLPAPYVSDVGRGGGGLC